MKAALKELERTASNIKAQVSSVNASLQKVKTRIIRTERAIHKINIKVLGLIDIDANKTHKRFK